mgnify:CR=1 FL=1
MDFDALELLLQASLPVQLILAILIIASITSWVLIFEKYFTLVRSTNTSHEIEDKFWDGEKIKEFHKLAFINLRANSPISRKRVGK